MPKLVRIRTLEERYSYVPELIGEAPILVHIGADTPAMSSWWLDQYPGGSALLVEADPDVVVRMLSSILPPSTTVLHAALYKAAAPVCLYRQNRHTANSVFRVHEVKGAISSLRGTVEVPGLTLADIVARAGGCDLLLINAEGAEQWALGHLAHDASLRSRVPQACISMHVWEAGWLNAAKVERLRAAIDRQYEVTRCGPPHLCYWHLRRRDRP